MQWNPQNQQEADDRGSTVENLQRKVRRLESELEKRPSSPERSANTTTNKEDNKVQAETSPHGPYSPIAAILAPNASWVGKLSHEIRVHIPQTSYCLEPKWNKDGSKVV